MEEVRSGSVYQNHSEKYFLKSDDIEENCFYRQYFHAYRERVRILRPRIVEAAKRDYGNDIKLDSLINVQKKVQAFVAGIVVKRIKQRPSVLKSLAAHELILPDAVIDEYTLGNEDFLELEDDDQHVHLTGAISMNDVATGCVLGFIGVLVRADVFEVHNVIFPTMAPQVPYPLFKEDKYIMFISGIAVKSESEDEGNNLFCLDLLGKWLCGYLPVSEKERMMIRSICRVVIAGESIGITGQGREYATMARYLIKNGECPNVESAAVIDKAFSALTSLVEVDLMPGPGDPATHLMPQQPFHRAVFPHASLHGEMLKLVTNPYEFTVDGVCVLGTSGQNVNDLKKFDKEMTGIDFLKKLLYWQHIAPTVPDTIDGFPFDSRDPLVIDEEFPHIFFAGNQSSFEHSVVDFKNGRKTLLLLLPKFSATFSAVLVNLRSLDVIELNFNFENRE